VPTHRHVCCTGSVNATLTAKLKLLTTPDQCTALRVTQPAYRDALNYVSSYAFAHGKMSNQQRLQRDTYPHVHSQFGLPAQMACNVPRQVGATYKGLWTKAKKNAEARRLGYTKKRYKGWIRTRPPDLVSTPRSTPDSPARTLARQARGRGGPTEDLVRGDVESIPPRFPCSPAIPSKVPAEAWADSWHGTFQQTTPSPHRISRPTSLPVSESGEPMARPGT